MKKIFLLSVCSAILLSLAACGNSSSGENGEVIVYNWGEYLDPETIALFEEETGIKVIYDEFETNEIMYPKVEAGATEYDVICPSDYMIQKMLENDLLAELNFDNLPNAKANIGAPYWEQSKEFDPENKYSVPYCWGTVGILYNKTMVDGMIDSWSVLWDEKYKDNILMQDSVRDAFMVGLKLNGFSMNSVDAGELETAEHIGELGADDRGHEADAHQHNEAVAERHGHVRQLERLDVVAEVEPVVRHGHHVAGLVFRIRLRGRPHARNEGQQDAERDEDEAEILKEDEDPTARVVQRADLLHLGFHGDSFLWFAVHGVHVVRIGGVDGCAAHDSTAVSALAPEPFLKSGAAPTVTLFWLRRAFLRAFSTFWACLRALAVPSSASRNR